MNSHTIRNFLILSLIIGISTISNLYSQIRINEILAANISSDFNAAWNHTDWVELYNKTGNTINLTGYTLTDDPAVPDKYTIYSYVTISPYSYLTIWLDKKEYISGNSVHTNFSLDAGGEFIAIYNSSGSLIDSVTFGSQTRDVSYGRLLSDPDSWGFFGAPTKSAANNTAYLLTNETAGEVIFSIEPGFYEGSVTVELTASGPADMIRYTLNGEYPKSDAPAYYGPLTISENTVIRARCYSDIMFPGDVKSATYFIGIEEPNLPVISLSTDHENFYDWTIGIYVDGTNGVIHEYCSPDKKVNWFRDWERPVNFEYFTQDGQIQINQLVGTKIFGGCSRSNALRSLSLISREDYGKKGIEYPFFEGKDVAEFKSLVLRNSGNDVRYSMLRDGFMQTVIKDRMDIDYQGYQPVLVYLNGEYFGLLNLREKMNEHYAAANHGVDPDNLDIIEMFEWVAQGDRVAYDELLDYIRTHDLNNDEAFNHVASLLDVSEFMNHYLVHIYYENEDWPQNNTKLWREKKEGAKWRIYLYDTDFGFGLYPKSGNTLNWATRPHISTEIFVNLLKNEHFKNEFIQRFAAHMNTTFKADRILPILDSLEQLIEPHIAAQVQKWHLPSSYSTWNTHVNTEMVAFANGQKTKVEGWITDKFSISGFYQLNITVDYPEQGSVEVCEVSVPSSYSGNHFDGIPVRLKAIPKTGFTFTGWTGDLVSSESELWVNYTEDVHITANFAAMDTVKGLFINEFLTQNLSGIVDNNGELEDWIELYNNSGSDINISGLFISDSAGYISKYQIPYDKSGSTIIPDGGYILLWADNDPEQGALHLPFKLKKGGETILLSQRIGDVLYVIDSISYENQYSDLSYGHYPDSTPTWKFLTPTPGEENQEPVRLQNVYINEFMASNTSVLVDEYGDYKDWIEIYNGSDTPVNIGGMFITDSIGNPMKYRIPTSDPDSTTIPANGYLVIWADDSTELGIRHLNFKLSRSGEQIAIVQPNGNDIIDSITYNELIVNAPYGRLPDGSGNFSYLLATPGESNTQPQYTGLFINEFMAINSNVLVDEYGEYNDWIEIYNDNDIPVNVGGLFLSDDMSNPAKFRISTEHPDSTTIPSKGHLLIWADDSTELGILHAGFKLSGSGEQIILSATDGITSIDIVTFDDQIADAPYGRQSDGDELFTHLTPTPGESNRVDFISNLFLNEVLASNSTIISDNYGEFDDWIEIYNANDFVVNIAGLFLTDNRDNPLKYRIPSMHPDSTAIEPNGYMLLWADDSTEQGILHTNFKLSRTGETITLFQADGSTVLDSLVYLNQNNDISFGRTEDGLATLNNMIPTPGTSNKSAEFDGIIISEIMSSDQLVNSDEFGEYDDWIELYNTNSYEVDIAGLSVTDSLELPLNCILPGGFPELTTIPPYGYITLWADNQPEQGPLHLDFKLREGGEAVGLYNLNGTQIDGLNYPNQYNNFSYALIDGIGWFVVPPTFGAENIVTEITNIHINEFMADNDNRVMDEFGEFDDWIEVYNANNFDVNIAGLYLSDSLNYPNKYRISSNSLEETVIPAKGFLIIWTDSDSDQGPLHTNFKLSRGGDQIGLFGYDYRESIDIHSFNKQPKNFACGRLLETGDWLNMPPTPAASNVPFDLSGLFINEIMTSNSDIIADNYGEYDDWVEFYNGGTVPVDLGGLFISDRIDDEEPFRISTEYPDSTTIDPGEFLLIWADDSVEQGILHTNFKLSRSGEQVVVYGYNTKEFIDSITYEEVPRNITFGRISDGNPEWNELFRPTPRKSNIVSDLGETTFITSGFQCKVYPNPTSTQANFRVDLTRDTRLTIKVYSNTGELIAIPCNGYFHTGRYDLTWDLTGSQGDRISKGMYFYTIETEDISVQDKLIILL